MEARDVVLIVLDGVEGHAERQVRQVGMDAVHLVDRHLVLFQIVVIDALLEYAAEKIVREQILLGESGGRDRLQASEVGDVGGVVAINCSQGAIPELIVVAIISKGGRAFGAFFEIGLVDLFKEGVLRGDAGVY